MSGFSFGEGGGLESRTGTCGSELESVLGSHAAAWWNLAKIWLDESFPGPDELVSEKRIYRHQATVTLRAFFLTNAVVLFSPRFFVSLM